MSDSRRGYALAVLGAVISGFSVYVNSFGVRLISDSTLYTTLKNGVTGLLLLAAVLLLPSVRGELRGLSRRDALLLALLAVVGGSVPYLLFFRGLQLTTATTGAVLNHAQFLFVAALAMPLLRERISPAAWAGLALLAAGSVAGVRLDALRLNEGAVLVLASSALFAGGVVLARHLLRALSLTTVLAAKMSAGAAILVAYSGVTGHLAGAARLDPAAWLFVVAAGVVLLGFSLATTGALRHAPALGVSSIGMAAPLITTALQLAADVPVRLQPGDVAALALTAAGALAFAVAGLRTPPTRVTT